MSLSAVFYLSIIFVFFGNASYCKAATLNVPSDFGSLSAALSAVQPNDVILFASGTFVGSSNCGQQVLVNNVTLAGSSSTSNAPTVISCNSTEVIPLVIDGSSTTITMSTIRDLTFENIGLPFLGAGIIYAAGVSSFFMINCKLNNGVLQGNQAKTLPFARQNSAGSAGAALFIDPKIAPVTISLSGVTFNNNVVRCTDGQYCKGGAVAIQIQNTVTAEYGNIFVSNSIFLSNQVEAFGSAKGASGAGLNVQNLGTAPFNINIESSTFFNNTAFNHETDALGVFALGGGFQLENINDSNFGFLATAFVNILDSSFSQNNVIDNFCGSSGGNNTANGAGIAIFSANNIYISGSTFEDNVATGNGIIDSDGSDGLCVSEGAGIFVQGLNAIDTPLNQQPIVQILTSIFTNNIANCSGTACVAVGGAINVVTANSVTILESIGTGNSVTCMGMGCNVEGGFLQVQNGCGGITCGRSDNMQVFLSFLTLSGNSIAALPPGYFTTPDAVFNLAPFGGAIAVQALEGSTTVEANNIAFSNNAASCAYEECFVFGPHVGQYANPAAQLNSSFVASQFTCGIVSCSGVNCTAFNSTWNGITSPPLFISGPDCDMKSADCSDPLNVCSFTGTVLPSGAGIHLSPFCSVLDALDFSTCQTDDGGGDDDSSSSSSNGKLSQGAVAGIVIACIVVAFGMGYCYKFYFQPNQKRKDTGLLNQQQTI